MKAKPATGSFRLSKSQYVRGLQCHKSLWLYRNRKDLIQEVAESQQMIFDQGHEVGVLAHQRFPGGRLIEDDYLHAPEAIKSTQAAVRAGARIIYEAGAIFDSVLVRPDIMLRSSSQSRWDVVEVKSSSEVKDVYLHDAAVQRHVLEGAGFPIRKASIMHINTAYVRRGPIDADKFFTLADISKETAVLLKTVPTQLKAIQAMLAGRAAPAIDIGPHCFDPYECNFKDHCWAKVPEYSIFDLTNGRAEKKFKLWQSGVKTVDKIPADYPLSKNQGLQVEVAKSGRPHIDKKGIGACLAELAYPLFFLDFETVNPAIPPYDGLRPFQQLAFQASLHVMRAAGGEVEHFEYLGDGKVDPRPGLAAMLARTIGPRGSVVAFNAGFEGMCLADLAAAYPRYKKELLSAKHRLWDLATTFRKGFYVHPGFEGSWSIKTVLPTLVPKMTYENLAVGNGGEAQLAYISLMSGQLSPAQALKVARDLKEYCGQDTMAMVELLRHLQRILSGR